MSVDPKAVVDMATIVVDQIVNDLNMMNLVHKHWKDLTPEERDDLAQGWISLITGEFQ